MDESPFLETTMGPLAEYLHTKAERLRVEQQLRLQDIFEWRESVRALLDTLSGWLKQADNGLGLIDCELDPDGLVKEPRLGEYRCWKLLILTGGGGDRRSFETVAEVIPKARFVLADIHPVGRESRPADGLVEIREGGRPSHFLFRWKNAGRDEWFIRNDAVWNNRSYQDVKPLTAEAFEMAVLSAVQ